MWKSITKDWDGDWDSPRGKEISAQMQKDEEYALFRNKILIEIGNGILATLAVIWLICAFLSAMWELSIALNKDGSAIDYIVVGIDNLLTVSPIHLRLLIIISIILLIIAIILFIAIPLPQKESK